MADLSELEKALGISFKEPSLLRRALTHSSYVNENPSQGLESNERLEFLGDAVLGYVVARELYLRFPDMTEGQLTELRVGLVRAESLTHIATRLGLGNHLYLGRGEEQEGGRSRPSNLGGALEAVIGAILLDRGIRAARRFVLGQLRERIRRAGKEGPRKDYKSLLQEATQARWKKQPNYATEERALPDGARVFWASATLDGRVLGEGMGPSKQAAQKEAAREALRQLESEGEGPQDTRG